MTSSDVKEANNKESTHTEDSTSSTTKANASAKKSSGRTDFVYDVRDRESFYKDLQSFHESRNTPIVRFPRVNGKEVDLHMLYAEVVKRGGWLKVNIRNEWDELLHVLGLKQKCVNATVALKVIYTRYLDKYERLHFLGEDPDRADEPDEEGRHKKWSTKNVQSVPMTYNYGQHQVSEPLRVLHRLSTDMYKPSEYDKLLLSLLSPLPNEQDFAINVCTLMANESQHTLKLDHCPKLVDALIAHAGVYSHFTMRDIFVEMYSKTRKHPLQTFWNDCLVEKQQILDLSFDDFSRSSNEKLTDNAANRPKENAAPVEIEKLTNGEEHVNEVAKYDFLCLGRGLGTHDYVGQRVLQVTSIMRNLSFFEENIPALATNRTFLRFLVMCSNVRWGNLHHMAFDIFGNLALNVSLQDPNSDELTRCILSTLSDGLEGQDRGVIISCLEILNKLSQKDGNAKSLNKCLDFKTYNQLCLFLALNDIMLLIYTLECLYGLSSLGPRPCNAIIQVKGIVDTLISLITVEAQSYGPDGCILMRVVETVPGNMLPMVAQNIANLQNVAKQGHVLASKKENFIDANAAESQKSNLPAPANTTPIRATVVQTSKEIPATPQTPAATKTVVHTQESDPFAIAWVTATFEAIGSASSRVEQQELYKMYLAACQKAGRRSTTSPIHFPQIVRTVLGPNVGPNLIKTTDPNGVEVNAFYYINIRVRANPMPVQYKAPGIPLHQPATPATPVQKVITKPTSPATPTMPQHQVKIVQQAMPDASSGSKMPEVGQKGKTNVQPQTPQPQTQPQLTQAPHPAPAQSPAITQKPIQQQSQPQPQIMTQLQENQLVAGKHVIISHSVTSQPVVQKTIPQATSHSGESNQPSVIQQPQQQPQVHVQQIQVPQQQLHMHQQQIQMHSQQPMQAQIHVQQHPPAQQVQIQPQQVTTQMVLNPNASTILQGNGNVPQTSSSLIKSLLANKVTPPPTANTDVNEANASAAPNNPSCLITQNVNLHQVAQRQQMKQLQLQQQQQQQHQHQNVPHATISALVNNPIIPSSTVKVGQTTIKAITTNAVIPASVIEKKPAQPLAPPPQLPQSSAETTDISTHWDPVPPLAPLSGNVQNIKVPSNILLAPGNDDSDSIGNNSVASSAISSNQIVTTDDGEGSLISFEGLLVPKSKSGSSSITEDDASKDSFNKNAHNFQGNQMLVDLLDKKSLDPPVPGGGTKRKYEDFMSDANNGNKRMAGDILGEEIDDEEMPMVQASKNAANLYAEMAASILEDEDLDDEPEIAPSIPVIQPPVEQKQVITMPVPIQRQIIMGPNNQVILTQPGQSVNQSLPPQATATATIKTDSGLQTVPLIIQKQIGPNGQQILQPVIQHQQQHQTQYVLATNPQGQTYLVAQQQPSQSPLNPALLLAQAGQSQGSQTKTIIILQQQGGPPQAVAQQQFISNPAGQQKVIMTTQQGQQMIVTQVPRTMQHHQLIVSNPNSNMMPNSAQQNVIISQSSPMVQQSAIQQQHIQIQAHNQHQQIQMQQSQQSQHQQIQMQQSLQSQHQQIQIQQSQQSQQQFQFQAGNTQTMGAQTTISQPQMQMQATSAPQAQIQIQASPHSVIQKQVHISQIGGTTLQMNPQTNTSMQTQVSQHPGSIQASVAAQQPQVSIQVQGNQQQQMPIQMQGNQQQQMPLQSHNSQQASILSQFHHIPATIKIHQSPMQTQTTQTQQSVKAPVKPQVVIQQQPAVVQSASQQQSVIQATPSLPRPDIKRQIVVTGAGPDSPIRGTTPTPSQPTNIAKPTPQSVQQPAPPPPQNTQLPVSQQPQNQQPQPPIQSPAPAKINKSGAEASSSEDDSIDQNWLWICDWRGCPRRQYKSLAEVYKHACTVHCPESLDLSAEIYCQWGPGGGLCDNIPRKRYSLMTHLLDRHCTVESFKAAVQRRLTTGVQPPTHGQPVTIIKNVPSNSSETRGTASPALSTSSSSSLPPAASAAMHAIKRHSNDFVNPKELMDENEGPVTKSIRLTAALILRNLVTYTSMAKRNLRCYEPHLAGVALSNVESSRTISQILYELDN